MTFKEKYYSIDQTKLPEKAKVYMEEFKKDTKNFTDKEAMKIIMPTLDGFIKKLKESGYESAIKTSQTEKPTKEKVVKKKTAKEMVKEIDNGAIAEGIRRKNREAGIRLAERTLKEELNMKEEKNTLTCRYTYFSQS
jgi:hypothetical protein